MASNGNGNGFSSVHIPKPGVKQDVKQDIIRDKYFAAPHIETYSGKFNSATKSYYIYYDEALRNSQANTLSMRRDGFVHEILRHRQLPVVSLPWHIDVDDPEHPDQKSIAEVVTKIINNIPRYQGMLLTLLEAIFYGKYAVQVKIGPTKVSGNKWNSVTDFIPVNGDKIRYWFDGTPGIAIRSGAEDDPSDENAVLHRFRDHIHVTMLGKALFLDTPFLRDRFIIHEFERSDTDYLFEIEEALSVRGLGLRSRLYWDWNTRMDILGWMLTALQRVGANGMIYGFFPMSNPGAQTQVINALRMLTQENVAAFPIDPTNPNWKDAIGSISPSTVGYDIMMQLIIHFEGNMRRATLGQDLSSQSRALGIGSGASNLHADVRINYIEYDANMLSETQNVQLLNNIILRYNKFKYEGKEYMGNDLPFCMKHVFDIDKENIKEKLDSAQSLFNMGVDMSKSNVLKASGIAPPKNKADLLINPQFTQEALDFANRIPGMEDARPERKALVNATAERGAKAGLLPPSDKPETDRKPFEKSRFAKPKDVFVLHGKLYVSKSGWGLLSVPNDLIYGLFDAINMTEVDLPPNSRHGKQKLNAHISVFTKDEIEKIGPNNLKERGDRFSYNIGRIKEVKPSGWSDMAKVWFIDVESPELEDLRESYGLSRIPKDGKHRFHISLAVRRYKGATRFGKISKDRSSSKDCGHDLDGSFSRENTCAGEGESDSLDVSNDSLPLPRTMDVSNDSPPLPSAMDVSDDSLSLPGDSSESTEEDEEAEMERYYDSSDHIFGREISKRELLGMIANDSLHDAFPNFNPKITSTGHSINIKYENSSEGIDIEREFKKIDGKPAIVNVHLFMDEKISGKGLGISIFTESVSNAIRNEVGSIHCTAGKGNGMNGYYTWPRFGYDGFTSIKRFHPDQYQEISEILGEDVDSLKNRTMKVSEFMMSAEGREFWKRHGHQFDAEFSLKKGSLSRRILSAYLKERGKDDPEGPDRFSTEKEISRWRNSPKSLKPSPRKSSNLPSSANATSKLSILLGTESPGRIESRSDALTNQQITIYQVGTILADQWANKKSGVTPEHMMNKWVSSKLFYLMKIPVWIPQPLARVAPGNHSYSEGPIIVDALKTPRDTRYGPFLSSPSMVILDGKHRQNDALERGDASILAYVGDKVRSRMIKRIFMLSGPRDHFAKSLDSYYINPNTSTIEPLYNSAHSCGLTDDDVLTITNNYVDGNIFSLEDGYYVEI